MADKTLVREIFYRTIEEHKMIKPGQHVILGLSGGPDSMCLAGLLMELREKNGIFLHAVHVNHQIRGEAADVDMNFVKKFCDVNDIDLKVVVFDCVSEAKSKKISTEEAGRNKRYESFIGLAKEISELGVNPTDIKIALAHNADDQAETVLFRIARGTGLAGLSGMSYVRAQGEFTIIRPILSAFKNEILEFCEEESIPYCVDKTNFESDYARNKVRLEVLPELEKINSDAKQSLIRLSEIASEDEDCLFGIAADLFEKAKVDSGSNMIILSGSMLRNAHPAISKRVIQLGLKELGLKDNLTRKGLEQCKNLLDSDNPSAKTDLPGNFYACRAYENLKLAKDVKTEIPSGIYEILSREIFDSEETKSKLDKQKGNFAAFDYDKIRDELGNDFTDRIEWRSRRAGDYIDIKGGSKKLQDLFVDVKVPKDMRERIGFAAVGSKVLFIPANKEAGMFAKYSPKFYIQDTTKTIIIIAKFSVI